MSKLVVAQFVTVDGVTQGPGGPDEDRDGGFQHGGWMAPYFHEDTARQIVESIVKAGSFLLGRRTYDIFAGHWPRVTNPDDAVATALNTRPKYVASRTRADSPVDWANSTVLTGNLIERVARLKRERGGEIQVHGSANLTQTLIEHDLVDEYRLWVFPVVLGIGKRLFGTGAMPAALRLASASTSPAGVAMHTYQRCGSLEYNSFGRH